jgi:hypothetical protein
VSEDNFSAYSDSEKKLSSSKYSNSDRISIPVTIARTLGSDHQYYGTTG